MLPQTRKKLWSNAANSLGCALVAFLLFALAPALSQAGENVVWKNDAQLQADPFGDSSLFPGSSLSGNTLTIPSGTPPLSRAHGGAGDKGAVFGNTVNIQGGDVEYATGGRSNSGEVSGNTVHMSGGSAFEIIGGKSATGTVRDNSVTITGGLVSNDGAILGGFVGDGGAGNVTGNSVTISDKATLGSDEYDSVNITGGKTYGTGDASSNTVTFLGGKVNGTFGITGGYSEGGNANSNKVTVTGLNAEYSYIVGGESGDKAANNNTVSVTGSSVDWINGGYSENGNANANTVSITGSDVGWIFGGESENGNADGNTVSVTGSDAWDIYGGESYNGNASGNTISVTGSDVWDIYGGYSSNGNANGNTVSVTGSDVGGIFGGYSENGNANGNTVSVTGSDVWEIYGGYSGNGNANGNTVSVTGSGVGWIFGGESDKGNASGNTVIITDSQIHGDVYGGLSHAEGGGASSSNNLVSLENVTITGADTLTGVGTIFGGAVQSGPNDQAINNTLILLGKNDLTAATLVGGSITGSGGDQFTGNTLIVSTDNTAEVGTVESFENFAFTLPASASDGYVALRANDIAFGDGADQNSRVTAIMHQGGASPLRTGDTITLFQLTEGELDTDSLESLNANRRIPGGKGVTLLYDFVLNEDGTAEVRSVRANPRAKALSEGFLSGVALTNQGADLTAGQGMDAAMRANAAARRNNGWGVAPFAVLSGGSSRYDTGSHIDLDSFSLMAGLSLGRTLAPCDLTLGLFFEYGYGDYDTHNGFRRGNNVKGSGDTSYIGGGLLGRMDFAPTGPGRFHLEASARAGELDTDFSSSDLRDMRGRKADYDTSSTYYGLHVGLGYDWNITEQASLDLYGKYFWTHVEGDSVTLPTKDPVHFKDVDSHRLRTGARFTYAVTEWCAPYIGAAWEYEFDGEAKAASYGYSLDSPDLKGNTGIGELGLSFTPSAKMPLSLDLAAQGYTGVREGVSGSLQFRLEF